MVMTQYMLAMVTHVCLCGHWYYYHLAADRAFSNSASWGSVPPPRHAMSAHCSRNTSIFCLPLPLCYPIICSRFPMHLACLGSHPDVFRFPAGPCFSSSDRPLVSVGILCCRNKPRQFGFLLVPNHISVLQTHLHIQNLLCV